MTSTTATVANDCQIVLTLAHLLRQHSLSYDTEKKSLLDTSVRCATQLAVASSDSNNNNGEVHIVLTGSPRPTFAETNAWLLEGKSSSTTAAAAAASSSSPKRNNVNANNNIVTDAERLLGEEEERNRIEENDRPTHLKGSYSIADNVQYSSSNMDIVDTNNDDNDDNGGDDEQMQQDGLLQQYINEFTNNSTTPNANMNDLASSPGVKTGESVLCHFDRVRKMSSSGGGEGDTASGGNKKEVIGHNNSFIRRNTTGVTTTTTSNDNNNNDGTTIRRRSTIDTSETLSTNNNTGPMVGHAVVNAISQSSGVGLQSSRSKLLQGTIDRPLWSQNRWTDGECLFSELVELCGMESFEMMGSSVAAGAAGAGSRNNVQQQGPDVAAGAAVIASPTKTTTTTNMSANLITVPATTLRDPDAGISPTTIDEIARGILRTVKRKKSPPASKVYIVLPGPNHGIDDGKRMVVLNLLKQAWMKLEQYNHMIGQPNLMSDAELEFVNVL